MTRGGHIAYSNVHGTWHFVVDGTLQILTVTDFHCTGSTAPAQWKKHIVFTRNVTNDPETHDEEMDFTDGGVRRLEYVGSQIIETQGHLVKCLEDGSVTGMARQRLTQALTAASVMIYID